MTRRLGAGLLLAGLTLSAFGRLQAVSLGAVLPSPAVPSAFWLALPGFAAGGLGLSLLPERFRRRAAADAMPRTAFLQALALLGVWAAFSLTARFPAVGALAPGAVLSLLLAAPWLFGGAVFGMALELTGSAASHVCAWGLAGAGIGAWGAGLLPPRIDPFTAVAALVAPAAIAAFLLLPAGERQRSPWPLALATVAAGIAVLSAAGGPLERGSRLTVYPLQGSEKASWGPSRIFTGSLPEVRGIAVDGVPRTPVAGYRPGDDLAWARWTPEALPYLLRPAAESVIIGAGGGRGILIARAMGAERVRAVEPERLVVRAVEEDLAEFSGRPYSLAGVEGIVEGGRAFLQRDGLLYDVVQVTVPPASSAATAVTLASPDDALQTVEAFHALLRHVREGGFLAVSGSRSDGSLQRIAATARTALEEGNARDPALRIFSVAANGLATVLVKKGRFSRGEVGLLEGVSSALGFEVLSSPSRPGSGPLSGVLSAGRLEEYAKTLSYDILPATDDRPFPRVLLRPRDLLAFAPAAAGREGPGDRVVLRARTFLAILLAGAAIVLLAPLGRGPRGVARPHALAVFGYFAAFGLGCAVVANALSGPLLLLAGREGPVAVAIPGAFLAGGAAGSFMTGGLAGWRTILRRRCALASLTILLAAILLPAVVEFALGAPPGLRLLGLSALAGSFGYLLCPPFPLGLALLRERSPHLASWALGVAAALGAAGAPAAYLVAVGAGNTTALMIGPACFLIVAAASELL